MKVLEYLEPSKQKILWEKLKNDAVIPVIDKETYRIREQILSDLRSKIECKNYHPQQLL